MEKLKSRVAAHESATRRSRIRATGTATAAGASVTGILGEPRRVSRNGEYLRSTAETVVVSYSLDATGAGHGHVTTLISEVDPDHGHRSHGCWCLGESALPQ